MQNIATAAFTVQDSSTAPSSRNNLLTTRSASLNLPQEALPSVIVLEIFQYLDFRSLLKCRLIYSGFRSLIDSTASLQYQIELALAGQQDGSYGDMFTRREMLKMHQKRWDGLQWTEVIYVPMIHGHWGLSGGVFAQACRETHTLYLKRIPSKSRGIKEKNWALNLSTLFGEKTSMGNFGMDPSQDLLVVVERALALNDKGTRLHLLTLSKGERHPLNLKPCFIPDSLISSRSLQGLYTEICHDFLSIRLIGGIVIWNWKTGQVLMHVVGFNITSMVFLNERYALMATKGEFHPYLLAVDFLAGTLEPRSMENCFIFRFPDMPDPSPYDDGDIIDNIIIRSNPRPANIDPSVPFSMAPQNRLLLVYLLSNHMNRHLHLCFAILEVAFLDLIKTGLRVNNNRFDWSMWGPEHSRIIPNNPYSTTWTLPSYGTRIAITKLVPQQKVLLDVYNFNRPGSKNKRQDIDAETPGNANVSESRGIIEGRPVWVLAPTRMKAHIFCNEIETRLRYRVTTGSLPGGTSFIYPLCSEDAVIIADEAHRRYGIYTV